MNDKRPADLFLPVFALLLRIICGSLLYQTCCFHQKHCCRNSLEEFLLDAFFELFDALLAFEALLMLDALLEFFELFDAFDEFVLLE